jgi:ABC-type transport system involved in cytochrome c biogenesis permease subunit
MTIHALLYAAAAMYAAAFLLHLAGKGRGSFAALCSGFVVHTAYQVTRGWIAGIFIPNGMFDGLFLISWGMALAVILSKLLSDSEMSWESAAAPIFLFAVLALVYPKGLIPPTPNKLTVWANIFFLTEVTGQACFYLAGWFAAVGIFTKRVTNNYHSLIVWGFVLYSIAQVTGAVWAYIGWATTFRWGSRHLQSAVIWCYFAAYLHLRFLPRWGAREKSWYAAAGFFVVAFNSLGSHLHEMGFPRIGG